MHKRTKIPGFMDRRLVTVKRLRVAAYCRVSTRQEGQDGSIEQQEQYYAQVISNHPNWTNAGVFSERVSGLRTKDRSEFQALMKLCRRGKVDLILVKNLYSQPQTPSGRVFFRHTALHFLEIHKVFLQNAPCLAKKSLAQPAASAVNTGSKSFSRLGRNTLDMLRALRELRGLDVDVYFEEENLWLHDERMEMLITLCPKREREHASEYPLGREAGISNGNFRLCGLCVLWIQTRR